LKRWCGVREDGEEGGEVVRELGGLEVSLGRLEVRDGEK
jgi:hypothetical protein